MAINPEQWEQDDDSELGENWWRHEPLGTDHDLTGWVVGTPGAASWTVALHCHGDEVAVLGTGIAGSAGEAVAEADAALGLVVAVLRPAEEGA
jgi:hypothetical protein